MNTYQLSIVASLLWLSSACAGPPGFEYVNPQDRSDSSWRTVPGGSDAGRRAPTQTPRQASAQAPAAQPPAAQPPTAQPPAAQPPAAQPPAAQAAVVDDPGTPHFFNPILQQYRVQFLQDRQRYEDDPDGFIAPDPVVDCPVSPRFRMHINKAHHKKKLHRRRQNLDSTFYGLKMEVLEGDCADGTLNGLVRYRLRYRERTTATASQQVHHLSYDVAILARFEDDVPTQVGRRVARVSSVPVSSNNAGPTQGSEWTKVSFYYSDDSAEDAAALSFSFMEGSNAPIDVNLRQPQPDGGTVLTTWEGSTRIKQEAFDADGNPKNRRGSK